MKKQNHDSPTLGILTINDIDNYGNRLQNYALQEVLKQYGNVTTIKFDLDTSSLVGRIKAPLRRTKKQISSRLKMALHGKSYTAGKRTLNNLQFTRHYVPDNKIRFTVQHNFEQANTPDIVILGSDQIWNYRFCNRDDLRVRLGLGAEPKHILAYAASIGVSEIPDDFKTLYREAFNRIPFISVREYRAKEIVEELTGKPATVTLDPTLMIDTTSWKRLFRGFVPNNDRYVLTYFLGKPSDEQEQIIEKFARTHNLRIRRILDPRDLATGIAGPADFVELFAKSSFVFTDSYHACCFSFLFNKDFKVFNRSDYSSENISMNSRMETLFRLFNLNQSMEDSHNLPTINHDEISHLLEQHRAESQQWLDGAISQMLKTLKSNTRELQN